MMYSGEEEAKESQVLMPLQLTMMSLYVVFSFHTQRHDRRSEMDVRKEEDMKPAQQADIMILSGCNGIRGYECLDPSFKDDDDSFSLNEDEGEGKGIDGTAENSSFSFSFRFRLSLSRSSSSSSRSISKSSRSSSSSPSSNSSSSSSKSSSRSRSRSLRLLDEEEEEEDRSRSEREDWEEMSSGKRVCTLTLNNVSVSIRKEGKDEQESVVAVEGPSEQGETF